MARIKVAQGSKLKFNVTAKNADGTAADLSTSGLKFAFIVFKQPGTPLFRYQHPAAAGWNTITPISLSTGRFDIEITPAMTKDAQPGNYDAEILVQAPSGEWISKNPGGKEFIELFASPTHSINAL